MPRSIIWSWGQTRAIQFSEDTCHLVEINLVQPISNCILLGLRTGSSTLPREINMQHDTLLALQVAKQLEILLALSLSVHGFSPTFDESPRYKFLASPWVCCRQHQHHHPPTIRRLNITLNSSQPSNKEMAYLSQITSFVLDKAVGIAQLVNSKSCQNPNCNYNNPTFAIKCEECGAAVLGVSIDVVAICFRRCSYSG